MLIAGAVRYLERVQALRKANFDSMQEDARSSGSSEEDDFKMLRSIIKRNKRLGRSLRDREALLLAQALFPVWSFTKAASQRDDPVGVGDGCVGAQVGLGEHVQGGGDGALPHLRLPLHQGDPGTHLLLLPRPLVVAPLHRISLLALASS